MSKQRKDRKTLNEIGKTEFEFDFYLERKIYMNLCHMHMKRRELMSLKEELRFSSYKGWKQYIYEKYENYSKDKLSEFSRYLNQRIRNIKPNREYWNLFIPVLLAFSLTECVKFLFETEEMVLNNSATEITVFWLIFVMTILAVLLFEIWQTITPIWKINMEENLFTDYKEIIDGILFEKENVIDDAARNR